VPDQLIADPNLADQVDQHSAPMRPQVLGMHRQV
jgi:hypothetical protein